MPTVQTITAPNRLKPVFEGLIQRGYNPRPPEKSRMLVLGLRKSGKSSFICSNPDACVLDFEGGCNAITNPRAYVADLSPTNQDAAGVWASYQKIKTVLIQDGKSPKPQFRTIGVDSIDLMVDLLATLFCREQKIENLSEYKSMGAGFQRVRERMLRELQDFEDAGYGLMIPSHLGEKTLTDSTGSSRLVVQPRLSDSFRQALLMRVDQIVHIGLTAVTTFPKKTITLPGGVTREIEDKTNPQTEIQVQLRTLSGPTDRERGCRVAIPDGLEIPVADGWSVYANAYNAEVARVRTTQVPPSNN
jgi:hypothetical protein